MDGLSADKMRVLLQPQVQHEYEEEAERMRDHDGRRLVGKPKAENSPADNFKDSIVLTTLHDSTRGKWKTAQAGFFA